MSNIEEEEEEADVVEIEPPKRKKIATLKVGSHSLIDLILYSFIDFLSNAW